MNSRKSQLEALVNQITPENRHPLYWDDTDDDIYQKFFDDQKRASTCHAHTKTKQ